MYDTSEPNSSPELVDTQASTFVGSLNSQQRIRDSQRGRRPRHNNSDFEDLKKIVQLRLDNLASNLFNDEKELVESFKCRNKKQWRDDLKSVSKTWGSKSDSKADIPALRIFQTLQRNQDWQDSVLNMLARRIKNKCLLNTFFCNELVSENPAKQSLHVKEFKEVNSKCDSELNFNSKSVAPPALSEIVENNVLDENLVNESQLNGNAMFENGQDNNLIDNQAIIEYLISETKPKQPSLDDVKSDNVMDEAACGENQTTLSQGKSEEIFNEDSEATAVTRENTAHLISPKPVANQNLSPLTTTLVDEGKICYCQQKYVASDPVVPCQICAQLFHYGEKMPHCDYDGFSDKWTCELCKPQEEPVRRELPEENDATEIETNSALNEPSNIHTSINSELSENDAINSAKTRSSNFSLDIRDEDSESGSKNTSNGETGVSTPPRENIIDEDPLSSNNMNSDDKHAEGTDCFNGEENGDAARQKVEEMAMLFGLDKVLLDYKIPKKFTATLHADLLGPVFDFNTMKFINHVWPSAIAECLEDYVPCAFHGKSTPLYYTRRSKGFCKLRGKCGGDCKMEFDIFIRDPPKKGLDIKLDVVANGNFQLYQRKPTSRPIKSDPVRQAMAKQLRNVKTNLVYLGKSTESVPKGLLLLHNNRHEHNLGTLKKLKSEAKLKSRTSMNLGEDLENLAKSFEDSHFSDSHTPGFIQRIECKDHLTIYLYDKLSIDYHFLQMQKRNKNREFYLTTYIDATGSLVKKYKDKQVLSFYIIGEHVPGEFYLIAEMITTDLTQESVKEFVSHITRKISSLDGYSSKMKFCDLAVSDFSLAIILGLCRGLCEVKLDAYTAHCWDIFSGSKHQGREPILYICQSHLIHAFKRNIQRNTKTEQNHIPHLATHAITRLAECTDLESYEKLCLIIVRLFGLENLPEAEVLESEATLTCKELPAYEETSQDKHNACDFIPIPEFFKNDTFKNKSEFYKALMRIKNEVTNDPSQPGNKYYSKAVINALDTYIPYYMLWGRFMMLNLVDTQFTRKTNAPVESQFNVKKTTIHSEKCNNVSDYIREAFAYFVGTNANKIRSACQSEKRWEKQPNESKSTDCNAKETWGEKRKTGQRDRRHYVSSKFTSKDNSADTPRRSPLSAPRVNLEKDRAQKSSIKITDDDVLVNEGEFQLKRANFKHLWQEREYVSDDIVQSYLHLLTKHRSEFYATCTFFAQKVKVEGNYVWSKNDTFYRRFSEEIPLNAEILHAVNIEEHHWFLLKISVRERECTVYDSFLQCHSNPSSLPKDLQTNLQEHFEKIYEFREDKPTGDFKPWNVKFADVHKQADGNSCGLHVLFNAEKLVQGAPLKLELNPFTRDEMLFYVLKELFQTTRKGKEWMQQVSKLSQIKDVIMQ